MMGGVGESYGVRAAGRKKLLRRVFGGWLLAAGFALAGAAFAGEPVVILLSWDGVRYDYLKRGEFPALARIQRDGTQAEKLVTVFPSLTFPSHVSLATGANVEFVVGAGPCPEIRSFLNCSIATKGADDVPGAIARSAPVNFTSWANSEVSPAGSVAVALIHCPLRLCGRVNVTSPEPEPLVGRVTVSIRVCPSP